VFTNEISVCYAFVNIKFNGVWKFTGATKILGFDTLSRCKSSEVVYHVS
jgi:hypothetical protein